MSAATAAAATRDVPGPSHLEAVSAFLRAGNVCDFLLEMTRRYGAVLRIPGRPLHVVLATEAHFQDVLVRSQRKFGKDFTLRPMELMCGPAVLYPGPDDRRKYQALFTPPLSSRDVHEHEQQLAGLIQAACSTLDRRFLGGPGVELEEVMLDLHYRVLMSYYLGRAVERPIGGLGESVAWLARWLGLLWNTRFLPTPQNFRARRLVRGLRAQVSRVVEERRSRPPAHDGTFDVAAACGQLGPAELAEHLLILLFASINIPLAAANCLHCVATHPAVSARIEEELASGGAGPAGLRAALDESLRLFPVSSFIARDTLEDHEVEGCAIPRGAVVILPTIVLNRDPSRWEDPLAFRPERFEGAGPRPDHYPYGLGPRYCIGAGYSRLAMPLLLERFLATYRLELVSARPEIRSSLPLSLRSTRVRLTAR